MSFSFTVYEQDTFGTILPAVIDDKVQALPEGEGKREAQSLLYVIPEVIKELIGDHGEFAQASVSGYASTNQANLSVTVTFKTVSANPPNVS